MEEQQGGGCGQPSEKRNCRWLITLLRCRHDQLCVSTAARVTAVTIYRLDARRVTFIRIIINRRAARMNNGRGDGIKMASSGGLTFLDSRLCINRSVLLDWLVDASCT